MFCSYRATQRTKCTHEGTIVDIRILFNRVWSHIYSNKHSCTVALVIALARSRVDAMGGNYAPSGLLLSRYPTSAQHTAQSPIFVHFTSN